MELQGSQDASTRAEQNKVLLGNSLRVAELQLAALTRPPDAKTDDPSPAIATKTVKAPKKSELLEAQFESFRMRYGENHPDMKRLRAEIAMVKKIEQSEAALPPAPPPPAAPVPGKAEASKKAPPTKPQLVVSREMARQIMDLQENITSLKTQIALVDKELEKRIPERERILRQIGEYQQRLNHLPLREQEMAAMNRDYDMAKANYRSLLDKRISAEMATDLERRQKSERFTVLDPAQPPQKPFKPQRSAIAVIGSVLGLAIGLAAACGNEFRKNTLLGEWELPKEYPILGRVPRIRIPEPVSAVPEIKPRRKWRIVAVSGAVFSLLSLMVAGAYLVWKRF